MGLKHVLGVCAAAGLAVGAFSQSADAALILNYNNGAVVVSDNGAGDSDPAVGRIVNVANIAGFGVSINVGTSNSPGTSANGTLQISSLSIENLNPVSAALSIRLSDTDYTLPGSGASPAMTLSSSVGGTFTDAAIGNTASFQSFADPANGQPAAAVFTAPLSFTKNLASNPESFSGDNSTNWVRGAGAYSLSNLITMNLSSGAQLNIAGTTVVTPEPTGLALLGILAAGTLARRRRQA